MPDNAEDGWLRHTLQTLGTGVCVADPESWLVRFENARFFGWFGPRPEFEDRLDHRLTGLDIERARARLRDGRAYTYETDVRVGARTVTLDVRIRPEEVAGRRLLVIECQDVSKRKEVEYMLDSYSKLAEKHARDLKREKERVEKLLLNIMPRSVYEEMKDFGAATPHRFDSASVLMLDFVGFTEMAISRDPSALIGELNDIFSAFDRIVEMFGCERIKTMGDGYLAVSGLPEQTPEHAANIAKVAVRMRRYLEKRNASHPTQWLCRIGLHTGPVIGSLVGVQKYVYDVFGPAVNLAARLEATSEPMQITLVEETYRLIGDTFNAAPRGEQEIKGFGTQRLYALLDEIR